MRNNILIHLGTRAGLELVHSSDVKFTDSNSNIVNRIGLPDDSVLTLRAVQASSAYGNLDTDSLSATSASLFIDASAANYDLLETAPAVDRGENLTQIVIDFAGRERPEGLATDIGAYEQSALTSSSSPQQVTFTYP